MSMALGHLVQRRLVALIDGTFARMALEHLILNYIEMVDSKIVWLNRYRTELEFLHHG